MFTLNEIEREKSPTRKTEKAGKQFKHHEEDKDLNFQAKKCNIENMKSTRGNY
jgi:hypothetical protein